MNTFIPIHILEEVAVLKMVVDSTALIKRSYSSPVCIISLIYHSRSLSHTKALFLLLPLQITPGSKASAANLCPGDVILAIEGIPASDMMHCEAQNKIKESSSQLCLTIERLYAESKKARARTGGGPSKGNTCAYNETESISLFVQILLFHFCVRQLFIQL